jgi:hypothetical protein
MLSLARSLAVRKLRLHIDRHLTRHIVTLLPAYLLDQAVLRNPETTSFQPT